MNLIYKNNFTENTKELLDFLGTQEFEDLGKRKATCFGVPYNFSRNIEFQRCPVHYLLMYVFTKIEAEFDFLPNSCLVNLYQDGGESIGWHSDNTEAMADGSGIVIVPLGNRRALHFRNKNNRTDQFSFPMFSGSALFMPKEMQAQWQHRLEKNESSERRYSLTFRRLIHEPRNQFAKVNLGTK